jgi:hypothetical protein
MTLSGARAAVGTTPSSLGDRKINSHKVISDTVPYMFIYFPSGTYLVSSSIIQYYIYLQRETS